MHIVLTSPITMLNYIVKWVKSNGSIVNENTNNSSYTYTNNDSSPIYVYKTISIAVQYHNDELYDVTIDKHTTFIIENNEVVCIEGKTSKLLETYDFCLQNTVD